MTHQLQNISIDKSVSILCALKQMDKEHTKLLIVLENSHFKSLVSIGDIQRAIIANISLETEIEKILRNNVNIAKPSDSRESILKKMRDNRIDFMPIVDEHNSIVDILFWDEIFNSRKPQIFNRFDLPVVIMAGGQGTRLRPLTNVLPKPLIPIGRQTIIEDIMDKFTDCGCHHFYISVNYKAEFIKQYIDGVNKPQYVISYFQEDKPLGTAGSLHLLKDNINSTFFVSNCDIVIDEDYSQILNYHLENENEITVVAAMKSYSIPYGTLETSEGGQLISLQEKPEITYKINTGMYVLEPHLINEIPSDRLYHITFLIEKLLQERRKVGVFPISEGAWTDIGNWDEYLDIINYKSH